MENKQSHPCIRIYQIGANGKKYGETHGICRITGIESVGLPFAKWVRDTFTDHASLRPGNIISNEALFCFDESSEIVMNRAGKEKPQRFRTYSHIIDKDGNWHCCTKADKQRIYDMIVNGAQLVCLTDSGQKHLLFKHKNGLWQLDDIFVLPTIDLFVSLHSTMMKLLSIGFSQSEVITGQYLQYRIVKCGLSEWKKLEDEIKPHRGSRFFAFTAWLLYSLKEQIND